MKNRIAIRSGLVCVALLLLSAGAFAQKVKYNYLQGTNFANFKTYKWARIDGAQYPNQLLDEQLTRSIDRQLAMKGLTKVDSDSPDLVVVYQVGLNQEKEWTSYSTGGSMWGWGAWGGWGGMETTYGSTTTITVGTLNLDIYDAANKKQIWRGEATKTLDPPKDPSKLQSRIDKAMAKLLKNYPPPAKK